jgi:hypothetical protein
MDGLGSPLKQASFGASTHNTPLVVKPVTSIPSATIVMAKSLRDYSTPVVANVLVGPTVNTRTGNFEL